MAEGWRLDIAELKLGVQKAPATGRIAVEDDGRFAQAALIIFQSVANQAHFILRGDALAQTSNMLSREERQALRLQIKRSVESEISLAGEFYTIVREDSRTGFEPSYQHFYLPLDIM